MPIAIPLEELPVYTAENIPHTSIDFSKGGIFLIDKPKRWSSFKVVRKLRKFIDLKKIGHAGTLDPMATGLLVLCVGKATKSIQFIQNKEKEYMADILFGATTPSYDAETEIEKTAPTDHITLNTIKETLSKEFNGSIEQIPPMYSAVKHKGKRLYKLARKGQTVERKKRVVTIYDTEIMNFYNPELKLRVVCSKGTYVRSLAYDLGEKLKSHAYLTALRRTRTGSYKIEQALTIQKLEEIFQQ
ncbi:MAG TPA: tRNA pseudouridine(55) synthase TruB [Balneolales bacterium]|nr:tRNA pseudouridine(55) synthase TruB [Balneolales bacterium]